MNRTKVVDKVVDGDEQDPGGTMVVEEGTRKTTREKVGLILHGSL